MIKVNSKSARTLFRVVLYLWLAGVLAIVPARVSAQQFAATSGMARDIDLVEAARSLDMQDMYSRSLYLHIRANPAVLDNPQYYVNFLAFLMSRSPGFQCYEAFSDEFERRDFFTQAFGLKDQLRSVVASMRISERFDIAYRIDTQPYDFATSTLPFSGIRSIGNDLSQWVYADRGQNCASQIFQGTEVDINVFPWRFQVVNEAAKVEAPKFPFGQSVQLPAADARTLFERFGRQLYALVSYQLLAASNGEPKIQVIATDGQLFGLSNQSVVRVKSFQHPRLSRPGSLDMTNPLSISVPDLGIEAGMLFKQEGFRAVGTGTGEQPGTGITLGGTFPIGGSAAVGNATFIMRLAVPQLNSRALGLPEVPGARRYLTLYGGVDFAEASENRAPVSGSAVVLQVEPNGNIRESQFLFFTGAFTPGDTPVASEPEAETSLLDESPIGVEQPSE